MRFLTLLVLLFSFAVLAGPQEDHAELQAMAEELLAKLYMASSTEIFCVANPEGDFEVRVNGALFMIDCQTRNAWVAANRG